MIINFLKKKIPETLPEDMEKTIAGLRGLPKKECLEKSYRILTTKYRGYRFRTYLQIWGLLINTLEKVWKRRGFLHCTNLNYLIRIFLVKSGCFEEKDIKHKFTTIWMFSPHQYLKVRMSEDKYTYVDLWGAAYGITLGQYARGFNTHLWSKER